MITLPVFNPATGVAKLLIAHALFLPKQFPALRTLQAEKRWQRTAELAPAKVSSFVRMIPFPMLGAAKRAAKPLIAGTLLLLKFGLAFQAFQLAEG
jgi:hypothetical protein